MLAMTCGQCKAYIMSYQKDGPGPLMRCYLDRIHHPEELEQRSPKLVCLECGVVVGSPMMYEKEDRPAYLMRPGYFFIKKVY